MRFISHMLDIEHLRWAELKSEIIATIAVLSLPFIFILWIVAGGYK